MPTRPSAARRRFHTDRVIAKRLKQAHALGWSYHGTFVRGRLDDEQWYLGCHRAACGICQLSKLHRRRERRRQDREWRRHEDLATGA